MSEEPLKTITPDSGKAEAIRFAEWIRTTIFDKDGYPEYWFTLKDHDWYWEQDKEGDQELTTEQLYDLFINETNKEK